MEDDNNKNAGKKRSNEQSLTQASKVRRTSKKRKTFMRKKDVENTSSIDFQLHVGDNSTDSVVSSSVDNLCTVDVDDNVPGTSRAQSSTSKSEKYKRYKQIVNKSRIKLKNSVLNKNTYFKSKTRLQRRKLGLLIHNQVVPAFGYKLFDVRILEKVMAESCICKYCKKARGKLTIKENNRARKGLAECVIFSCNYCSKETITYTSQKVGDGNAMFDVNIRSIYASLPFGQEGLAKFCGVMDLPPPVLTPSYQKGREKLAVESSKLAEESMKSAAQRLIDIIMEKHPDKIDIQNDVTALANIAVSIDGTCQRRGHASKHGVIFLISVETGEVLDYSVKTLYCHECTRHKKTKQTLKTTKIGMKDINLIVQLIIKAIQVLWSAKQELICFYVQLVTVIYVTLFS